MSLFLVETVRGSTVESRHHVSLAVADAGGRIVAQAGDASLTTFMRSAAKPFQAIPLVTDGAAERFRVTPQELALACASHNSEPEQVALVRGFLDRLGLSEHDVACGPHPPLWRDLARLRETERPPEVPRTPLASNCSGKHTAMLALAQHHGWPTGGYQAASHPVQQRIKREIVRFTGLAPDELEEGVDGCGVVSYALPLSAMARAWARLATSHDGGAAAVVAAMRAHPDLVAGRGRLCTALMRRVPAVIAKVGAEGVYGAALLDRGWGVALKVEDGSGRAAIVALVAVLDQLGVNPRPSDVLPEFAAWPLINARGDEVGVIRAAGRIAIL